MSLNLSLSRSSLSHLLCSKTKLCAVVPYKVWLSASHLDNTIMSRCRHCMAVGAEALILKIHVPAALSTLLPPPKLPTFFVLVYLLKSGSHGKCSEAFIHQPRYLLFMLKCTQRPSLSMFVCNAADFFYIKPTTSIK